jgi:hypothetical protein
VEGQYERETASVSDHRECLRLVGSVGTSGEFDEQFPSVGGEDIDLGLRLWSVGPLAYAPAAQTLHTFEPCLSAFIRRFVRYGRGNALSSGFGPSVVCSVSSLSHQLVPFTALNEHHR